MKRLFAAALLALTSIAFGATTIPPSLITPTGSTAGQAILSTGPGSAPAWGPVALSGITGTLGVANGGTGATTASAALANLGGMPTTGGTFTGNVDINLPGATLNLRDPGTTTGSAVNFYLNGNATWQLTSAASSDLQLNRYNAGSFVDRPWSVSHTTGVVALNQRPTFNGATPWDSANLVSPASTTGNLSQFASTTSAQVAAVVSDETGSGSLVFANAPALTGAPTAPTAAAGTSTTQLATTAFAQNAVTGGSNAGAFTTLSASANDALLYTNTSGQSIPTGANTTVTTWTKTFDRLNTNFNATTGLFTAPATGYYRVDAQVMFSGSTTAVGNDYSLSVLANGVAIATGDSRAETTSSIFRSVQVHAVASLTAGQTIGVQAFQNTGAALALSTAGGFSYLAIQRIP